MTHVCSPCAIATQSQVVEEPHTSDLGEGKLAGTLNNDALLTMYAGSDSDSDSDSDSEDSDSDKGSSAEKSASGSDGDEGDVENQGEDGESSLENENNPPTTQSEQMRQ